MATLVLMVACAASCKHGEGDGTTADENRRNEPQPITRKDCAGGLAQTVDVNNDGRADITHRTEGGKRRCSEIDLNFDGRPDLLRFYAADGTAVGFEQHDFDFDGKIDDNVFYKAGKLERKELDTNFDGLIDTWLWCQGPLVQKAERARRKPGRVDTWESYQNGQLAEVQYDENNDGVVEKWDTYRQGALYETRIDTNSDGKADRTDPAESGSDDVDARVSCDGSPLPEMPSAPASAPALSGDGGVPAPVFGGSSDAGVRTTTGDAGVARPADAGAARPSDAGAARPSDAGAARPSDAGAARTTGASSSAGVVYGQGVAGKDAGTVKAGVSATTTGLGVAGKGDAGR